jgi:hypothetical protein
MESYNPNAKQIGSYLIDAGLLDQSQVDLALSDQKSTGMRFGDIIVSRGWVKKQTLEYILGKVVVLERTLGRPLNKQLFEKIYLARKNRQSGSL